MQRLWVLTAVTVLAGMTSACTGLIPASSEPRITPAPADSVTSAAYAGVTRGPAVSKLGMTGDDASTALVSFMESCPKLLRRTDTSGLTDQNDWRRACNASADWPLGRAAKFFNQFFETAQIGDGKAFATGYFEPQITGSRFPKPGFDTPVYKMPPELVRAWPDDVPESERTGRPPLGRYDASGTFVSYYDRAQIEDGALANRGLEIGWAADPVEFFFLQIQGSGRLVAPDGTVTRIGYAGQNGREYAGIGGIMRERGLLGDGPGQYAGSMQGIMQYIRENPAAGRDLMRLNKSWIFFRILEGDGPLGALEVPVRRESSVAADPRFVPLGAPVWLDMDRGEADGMWIAQDTGGAIKGANRFDTFWGAGKDSRLIAGGMSARGQALILLPKGTVKRLTDQ